ncbi:MAG: hypothetical protein AAF692_12770 [Pseudomonadota bacterium]
MTAQPRLDRIRMPDWPRLMPERLAASYLGIGASTLRASEIKAKKYGTRTLYDRRDLDRWADALDGQPLDASDRGDEAKAAEDRIKGRLNA